MSRFACLVYAISHSQIYRFEKFCPMDYVCLTRTKASLNFGSTGIFTQMVNTRIQNWALKCHSPPHRKILKSRQEGSLQFSSLLHYLSQHTAQKSKVFEAVPNIDFPCFLALQLSKISEYGFFLIWHRNAVHCFVALYQFGPTQSLLEAFAILLLNSKSISKPAKVIPPMFPHWPTLCIFKLIKL